MHLTMVLKTPKRKIFYKNCSDIMKSHHTNERSKLFQLRDASVSAVLLKFLVPGLNVFQKLSQKVARERWISFPALMKALQSHRAIVFDFRILLCFQMPADYDVHYVLEVRLEVTVVVLGDDSENASDCYESFSNVRLLKKVPPKR